MPHLVYTNTAPFTTPLDRPGLLSGGEYGNILLFCGGFTTAEYGGKNLQPVHLLIDAMGGDHAPQAPVQGSIQALRNDPHLRITLAGVPSEINQHLTDADAVMDRVAILDAPDTITNHDAPAIAIRQKKQSSIVMGMLTVREGKADGFVSAGSTGAVLMGGMLRLGRIPGIERPAIAPLIPNGKAHFLLIDGGANVDCKPEYLVQFGMMGDAYMRNVMQIKQPRVGLVNIGDEVEKGNNLTKAAYAMMEDAPFHFVGNVEARYITADQADVLVCDGFDGNIILKYTEGLASTLLGIIKAELMRDTRSKIGALLAKPAFGRVKKMMDYREVGGAPLLGVRGAVVKAHGSSNAQAMTSAIYQATRMVRGNVVAAIGQRLNHNN